jgi:hypothetical protein
MSDRINPKEAYINRQRRSMQQAPYQAEYPDMPMPVAVPETGVKDTADIIGATARALAGISEVFGKFQQIRNSSIISERVSDATTTFFEEARKTLDEIPSNEDLSKRLNYLKDEAIVEATFGITSDTVTNKIKTQLEPILAQQFMTFLDEGFNKEKEKIITKAEETMAWAIEHNNEELWFQQAGILYEQNWITHEDYLKSVISMKKKMQIKKINSIGAGENGYEKAQDYVADNEEMLVNLGFDDAELGILLDHIEIGETQRMQRERQKFEDNSRKLYAQGVRELANTIAGNGNFSIEYINELNKYSELTGPHLESLIAKLAYLTPTEEDNKNYDKNGEDIVNLRIVKAIENNESVEELVESLIQMRTLNNIDPSIINKAIESAYDMEALYSRKEIITNAEKQLEGVDPDLRNRAVQSIVMRMRNYLVEQRMNGLAPSAEDLIKMADNIVDETLKEEDNSWIQRTNREAVWKKVTSMMDRDSLKGALASDNATITTFLADDSVRDYIGHINSGVFIGFEGSTKYNKYTKTAEDIQIKYMELQYGENWKEKYTVFTGLPGGKLLFTDEKGESFHLDNFTINNNGGFSMKPSLRPADEYFAKAYSQDIRLLNDDTIYRFIDKQGNTNFYVSYQNKFFNLSKLYNEGRLQENANGQLIYNINKDLRDEAWRDLEYDSITEIQGAGF